MTKLETVLLQKNGKEKEALGYEIERRIRHRYSLSQELAILRQRDTKPEEFAEYHAYAELCKAEVREEADT